MSAHVRTDRDVSPDGRFELVYDRRDDDDPWGSQHDESWEVRERASDACVLDFHGTSKWSASGHTAWGVKHVAFDPGGAHVIVTHHDGRVERVALP